MLKDSKPFCDFCHKAMEIIRQNEDGDEVWPYEAARAHICNQCFDEQVHQAWAQDKPCKTLCRNEPCKRGGDCWYTPDFMRNLPYETYYADRIGCENCTPGYLPEPEPDIGMSEEEFAVAVDKFCEQDLHWVLVKTCGIDAARAVRDMLPYAKQELCLAVQDALRERIKEVQRVGV